MGACVKSGLSGTSVCPGDERMIICKYLRCSQMHGCVPAAPLFFWGGGRYIRTNQNIAVCKSCHLQFARPYNKSTELSLAHTTKAKSRHFH